MKKYGSEQPVKLVFDPLAAENLDQARHDTPLHAAFVEALETIAGDAPEARETPLRVHGGTSWAIRVLVSNRDDEYQIVWVLLPDGRVYVAHLGRVL